MASFGDLSDDNFWWWNTAPRDPMKDAARAGRAHYNRVLGKVLMPQSAMPVGEHWGKIMERVPKRYLAWVEAQPWAARWRDWGPVREYLTRFPVPEEIGTLASSATNIIRVDRLRECVPDERWRWTQSSHLHVARAADEDLLHAFAVGALGLKRQWFQKHAGLSHYDLTPGKHAAALRAGAVLVGDDEMAAVMRDHEMTGGQGKD